MSVAGAEFAQFAESQPHIWSRTQGAIISHADFGDGVITTVQHRKGHIPLLEIKFFSESMICEFNTDAFKNGDFTNIQIQDELLDSLTAWKKQMAIETSQIAAKKATQKKAREKKSSQSNNPSVSTLKKFEDALRKEALSMTPTTLKKEIDVLTKLATRCPSATVNLRLDIFKREYGKRPDCGPPGREIRVVQTS